MRRRRSDAARRLRRRAARPRSRAPSASSRTIAPGFDALLAALHPRIGRARRIGITGPPGAGKSTLTTRARARATATRGSRVGIIAVDPTSPFTGGALLGDRIRMESVALDPGVFIRSMATRGSLGGLAAATREVARRARRVRHRSHPHRDGGRRTERARHRAHGGHERSSCSCPSRAIRSRRSRRA